MRPVDPRPLPLSQPPAAPQLELAAVANVALGDAYQVDLLFMHYSGTPSVDWRGDRPENPQLPVYALLRPLNLAAVAYARVNAADSGFVAEAARDGIFRPGGHKTALEDQPDFASLIALWSRRIEKIAAEFAAGDAAVAPTLRACASCALQALCRVPAAAEPGGDDD